MSYDAKISFHYDSKWTYDSDYLPEEHITMEFPAHDLSTIQLFGAFRKFLLAAGQRNSSITAGALSLAFNESLSDEEMRKTAEEYDLILIEDHHKKVVELEKKIHDLEVEIIDLSAHLSRKENPDFPQYTDEEMEAMSLHAKEKGITRKTLENAYKVCPDCGDKYGEYVKTVSSWWQDNCDVCGEERAVTECRDYGYLKRGIEELSK